MTTPSRTRAPYQIGDHLSALGSDDRGTFLNRAARIVDVRRTDVHPDYPWTITYTATRDQTRTTRVDADGRDTHRYIEPSISTLTLEETWTETGQTAIALATALRRAGVPGPLATTTGGNNTAVVLTWPSGTDHIVIGVEVWDASPVFNIGTYPDDARQDTTHEHTTHTISATISEVLRLLAMATLDDQ